MKQRLIKFRAWDKEKKIMVGDIDIDHKITVNEYIRRLQEYYVLMQFTGLKDKNGKETYEGDIVKAEVGGYHFSGTKKVVAEIIWGEWDDGEYADCETWVLKNVGGYQEKDKGGFPVFSSEFEVIGNIYENPDLI